MRWEFSAPRCLKKLAFPIQAPEKWRRYLRTHRMVELVKVGARPPEVDQHILALHLPSVCETPLNFLKSVRPGWRKALLGWWAGVSEHRQTGTRG